MGEPSVVFIPTPLKDPITGGERYEAKLLGFLRKRLRNVEPVRMDVLQLQLKARKSSCEMVFIGLRSIIRNLLYVLRITKRKRDRSTDRTVVLENAYYSLDLFLFNFLVRRIRRNVVIVPMVHHLNYILEERRFYRILLKAVETSFLNESDWVIVNSEATEKDVKELLEGQKKILVAYPGLDKEKMASKRVVHSPEDRPLRILGVGSVTERKDLETFLKAIKVLIRRSSKVRFSVDIVGDLEKDREFSKRMAEIADALALSNHVAFNGRVDDTKLHEFYARSDIFVSTSLHEGFGMAIAEAMYNRLPVVAMNCGAVPFLVEDGVNGFLVPPKDYERLAERIRLLLESGELRKKMGAKGFHKAKKFDWDRTFRRIYETLLEIQTMSLEGCHSGITDK